MYKISPCVARSRACVFAGRWVATALVFSGFAVGGVVVSTPRALADGPYGEVFQAANLKQRLASRLDPSCFDDELGFARVVADSYRVMLRRVDEDGEPTGPGIFVSLGSPTNTAALVCLSDGTLVVAFEEFYEYWIQKYDRELNPIGARVALSKNSIFGYQIKFRWTSDARLAVLGFRPEGSVDPFFRYKMVLWRTMFDIEGNVTIEATKVGQLPAQHEVYDSVELATDSTGMGVVAWVDSDVTGREYEVSAETIDLGADNIDVDSYTYKVDTLPYGRSESANVFINDSGDFLVTWYNSYAGGVVARKFSIHEDLPSPSTTTSTIRSTTTTTLGFIDYITPAIVEPARPVSVAEDGGTTMLGISSYGQLSRSIDGGRHWSDPYPITDKVVVSAGIAQNSGTWITVLANSEEGADSYKCGLVFLRSIDAGLTWAQVLPQNGEPLASGPARCRSIQIATYGVGGWLASWAQPGQSEDSDALIIIESKDDGLSWKDTSPINASRDNSLPLSSRLTVAPDGAALIVRREGSTKALHRSGPDSSWSEVENSSTYPYVGAASIRTGADGHWTAVWSRKNISSPTGEKEGADFDIVTAFSSDSGASWSRPKLVAEYEKADEAADVSPLIAVSDDGELLVAWSSYYSFGGRLGFDADLVAVASYDQGVSWSPPEVLTPQSTDDVSAETITSLVYRSELGWTASWTSYDPVNRLRTNFFGPDHCGDGQLQIDESCDDGNTTDGDGCDSNCSATGCGNSIVTTGEECDDGNFWNGDLCLADCQMNRCGDATLAIGFEQCDDGNNSNNDGCLNNCKTPRCGDRFTYVDHEECNDGNYNDNDGCNRKCTIPRCGDNMVTNEELCDDGNLIDGDGCDSNCTKTACGNGIITAGEECEDFNINNYDDCTYRCLTPKCGDGFWNQEMEICDDGNTDDTDYCTGECEFGPLCLSKNMPPDPHSSDAFSVLRYALGTDSKCSLVNCDIDADGDSDTSDALSVLRAAVGLSPTAHCPVSVSGFVVRLESTVTLGALQFDLQFPDGISLLHDKNGVAICTTPLVRKAIVMWNDRHRYAGQPTLTVGGFGLFSFDGPTDIVSCRIEAADPSLIEKVSVVLSEAITDNFVHLPTLVLSVNPR